jgi:hypothetical protein
MIVSISILYGGCDFKGETLATTFHQNTRKNFKGFLRFVSFVVEYYYIFKNGYFS